MALEKQIQWNKCRKQTKETEIEFILLPLILFLKKNNKTNH